MQLKPDEIRFWEMVYAAFIAEDRHNTIGASNAADKAVEIRRGRVPDQSPPAGTPYRRNLG